MDMLKAALKYREMGFSVIPVKADKRPYIKWEQYQHEKANEDQIKAWWKDYPNANVAIITGAISGLTVIDADSKAGVDAINDMMPDAILTPISTTPRNGGRHFYFSHSPGIANKVRALVDCDVRNDGGYVVAPPSVNGNGAYKWMSGLKVTDVTPQSMPGFLFDTLQQSSFAMNQKQHVIDSISSSIGETTDVNVTGMLSDVISFKKGGRDDALFRLANYLVKGGMPESTIREYLLFFASKCDPPFAEREAEAKIRSALDRKERLSLNLTQEVREYVLTTIDNITVTNLQQIFGLNNIGNRKKLNTILSRLVNEGTLKRVGNRSGIYRRAETDCEPENWLDCDEPIADVWLPWELWEYAKIPHGGMILFAGEPNSGKTAAALNIIRENMRKWNVHYFSSEISAGMFKRRLNKFPDIVPSQWKVNFYSDKTIDQYVDIIGARAKENDLYIIDYLEIYDSFWQIGQYLADLHKALNGKAISVINIQKGRGKDLGLGGDFTQFKPSLSVSVKPGVSKVMKLKEWDENKENINHKEFRWKLVGGCQFIKQQTWHYSGEQND